MFLPHGGTAALAHAATCCCSVKWAGRNTSYHFKDQWEEGMHLQLWQHLCTILVKLNYSCSKTATSVLLNQTHPFPCHLNLFYQVASPEMIRTVLAERPGPRWATMAPEMALIQLCMSSGLSAWQRETQECKWMHAMILNTYIWHNTVTLIRLNKVFLSVNHSFSVVELEELERTKTTKCPISTSSSVSHVETAERVNPSEDGGVEQSSKCWI